MDLKKNFGQQAKKLRVNKGLTQEKLSELTEYGIVNISRMENGKTFPSPKMISALALALDVPIKELFDFEQRATNFKSTGQKKQLIEIIKKATPKQVRLIYDISLKVIKTVDS